MRKISFRLPDDLIARLDREAKAMRVTKSEFVREALGRILCTKSPDGGSCYDLARDLTGRLKHLPKDLAVNPKYMEGFGR